jgi:hypothetical protein
MEESGDLVRLIIVVGLILVIMVKTFFFMRMFDSMAHLVSMIQRVAKDLSAFIAFFFILLQITSLILSVIGVGVIPFGEEAPEEGLNLKNKLKGDINSSGPGVEYQYLPVWIKQILSVLRMSLGDFDFAESTLVSPVQNYLFWMTWLILVIITCIVFMNFIIAEVSSSYTNVQKSVMGHIQQDRAQLIQESEDMLLSKHKSDPNKFPKYLIKREIDH